MAKNKNNQGLFKSAIIEKRNVLNEIRSNNMTLQELRFFSIYLSKINSRDISTRVVCFPLEDFQKIMEFGRLNIGQLQASTNSLLCKVVNIPDDNGGYTAFTLFKRCKVFKNECGEWFIEINASDDALPLMFDFKNRYFTYELWNALKLKSPNQIRMYELLKQYEHLGKREISVQELRELLGIAPAEYPRWNNFKVRVLDSCQQALAENTDIKYTYERGKTGQGGKWLTIVFKIYKNNDYIDQLTLDEFIDLQDTSDNDYQEPESRYSSDMLAELARQCNFEFDDTEMQMIFSVIKDKELQPDEYDSPLIPASARQTYLSDMYIRLNYADKKGQIKTKRFAYFLGMLKNDVYGGKS